MDEATKQALNEFVQKMLAAAEDGAKWTADQAPLLVQEWLTWQLAEAAVRAIALAIAAVIVGVYTVKFCRREDWEDFMPFQIASGAGSLILAINAFTWALTAVKVLVAPRVVVLEKFMELVR